MCLVIGLRRIYSFNNKLENMMLILKLKYDGPHSNDSDIFDTSKTLSSAFILLFGIFEDILSF